jgi:hypothetical protein
VRLFVDAAEGSEAFPEEIPLELIANAFGDARGGRGRLPFAGRPKAGTV